MIRTPKVLLMVFCCVLAFGCSTGEKRKVSVHGNIEHLGRSPLFISYYKDKDVLAYDTIYSNHSGKFDFKTVTYNEITPITIYFSGKKCWTTLFARCGDNVSIKGDINMVDLLNISGGTVNNDLNRFKKEIRKLYHERQAILEGKYTNGEETEERLAEMNLMLKRTAKEFIKENTSSVASVVLIQDFFYQDYDPSTVDLLNLLEGEAKNNHLTIRIREGIQGW